MRLCRDHNARTSFQPHLNHFAQRSTPLPGTGVGITLNPLFFLYNHPFESDHTNALLHNLNKLHHLIKSRPSPARLKHNTQCRVRRDWLLNLKQASDDQPPDSFPQTYLIQVVSTQREKNPA